MKENKTALFDVRTLLFLDIVIMVFILIRGAPAGPPSAPPRPGLAAAMADSAGLTVALKLVFARPRPPAGLLVGEALSTYLFPAKADARRPG